MKYALSTCRVPILVAALLVFAGFPAKADPATPIRITDMTTCQPADAISPTMAPGKWQRITYETANFSGTMLGALSSIDAPDLTLPLNQTGWHRIHVGYWNPLFDWEDDPMLKVRLSDQPAFHLIRSATRPNIHHATSLREQYFDCADLTGRDLVLSKFSGVQGRKAYYAYVRLKPMTPEEVAEVKKDRADQSTRRLSSTIDGMSYFHWGDFRTKEDILALVEPYRYSDVGRILWAVNYGERVNYPSKTEDATQVQDWCRGPLVQPNGGGGSYLRNERQMYDSLLALNAEGVVPQRAAADLARSMGITCCAMLRLGILGPIPQEPESQRLISRHPEFRMLLADGTAIEKASYAFPEVRQLMIDIGRESVTDLGLDGVNLCFIRGPHFTQYEQPVLDAFNAACGKDARTVDPNDPELLKVRASFMTQFVRDMRRMLDEVGKAQGRQLELSIWAWPTTQAVWLGGTPAQEGLDIKAWITEGLLDDVIFQEGVDPECQALCKEHDCTFTLFTGYRGEKAMSPASITKAYGAGVERFAFWDMPHRQIIPTDWAWLKRVGHPEEMASWDPASCNVPFIQLKTVGGADVEKSLQQAVFSGG